MERENFIENIKEAWCEWKEYKKEQFKFSYKPRSEEKALTLLFNLSNSDAELAIKIIDQSIANGWKGFFELKINNNATVNANTKPVNNSSGGAAKIARRLATNLAQAGR